MRMVVIGLLVLLVAGVAGCGRVHRYDGRLVAVDSLMKGNPDSALALVEALSPDSLTTDGDRAYRDLLVTQARYKCYVKATSDSDINRALDYYSHHSSDREKLTRAYIYKGAVMEELNHPDSAMYYYKTAEATAAPDDYFNQGYTNLKIAELYQSHYSNDTAVVSRTRLANHYFMLIRDTSYLITTAGKLGSYPKILGKDSARIYLNQAVNLSKRIHSHKGLQYQSKLAGMYFYDGDYHRAKDLAMDIFRNGRDYCNEDQFYYYAARSYIRLNYVDSAQWLIAQIPAPVCAVDSMNHFLTLAELAQATKNYNDYARFEERVKNIDTQIMERSRNEKLTETELKWDASQLETELQYQANYRIAKVFCMVLLVIAILTVIVVIIIKNRINHYRMILGEAKIDLERLINDIKSKKEHFELERKELLEQIAEKDNRLSIVNKKYHKLEMKHEDVHERASAIVREKNAALNELYDYIRLNIQAESRENTQKSISLSRLIKNYHENRAIRLATLKDSFWNKLKSSVDLEYNGIASFVENNYPQLTVKEFHLFCLLCANVSPQIIMLCMNYGSAVTVSKYKSKFISKRIGIDVSFDDFIKMYLRGELSSK